jgi:hypothetical protein
MRIDIDGSERERQYQGQNWSNADTSRMLQRITKNFGTAITPAERRATNCRQ